MLQWSVEFASGEVIHQESHPSFDFTEDAKHIQDPRILYVRLHQCDRVVAIAHIPAGAEPVYHVIKAGEVGAAVPRYTRIGWKFGKRREMLIAIPVDSGPIEIMEDILP